MEGLCVEPVSIAVVLAFLSGVSIKVGSATISSLNIPEGGGTGVEDGVLSASLELGVFVRAETGEALLSG